MIHSHYVFWIVAPVGLLAVWYATPRLTRLGYSFAVLLLYAVVILSGADYSAPPSSRDLVGGLLVTGSPFLAVLGVALGTWSLLRRTHQWLAIILFPLAYYLGFTAAAIVGMTTGIALP